MSSVEAGLIFVGLYLAIGAVIGVRFTGPRLEKLDPATHGASWGFRLLILPGMVAMWPWVLTRGHMRQDKS